MHPFAILADDTRRQIVELLAGGDRSAGEIAAHFPVSRPAVSRHLRVLRAAGLVRARVRGQHRVYALDPAPLAEVDAWLAACRRSSAQRRDALDSEAPGEPAPRGPDGRRRPAP